MTGPSRKSLPPSSGLVLLEYVFSIFAFMLAALAAFDCVRIIQVRSGLTNAAEVTAREMAVLDGSGSIVNPGSRTAQFKWRMYDWADGSLSHLQMVGAEEGQMPARCASLPKCEPEFVRLDDGEAPSVDLSGERAFENFGKDALLALVPRARFDCQESEPECVKYSFREIEIPPPPASETAPLKLVEVTYEYRLPLVILRRFGLGDAVTIKGRAERALESSFKDNQAYFSNGDIGGPEE